MSKSVDFLWQSDDCYIICPHCGDRTQAQPEDYTESGEIRECEKCGKQYRYYTEFSVTHHTEA